MDSAPTHCTLRFQSPLSYVIPDGAVSIVAADVTGDTKLDLVVGDARDHAVTVLRSLGGGIFAPGVSYPVDGDPASVAAGDLDGDGDLDVIAGNDTTAVSVLLNNGDGTFATYVDYPNGIGGPGIMGATLADMNHDGKLDIIETSAGQTSVLLGNGNGTFQAPHATSLAGIGTSLVPSFGILDVNGDTKLDVYEPGTSAVNVLLGDGSGGFVTSVGSSWAAAPSYAIAGGDINGDGHLDLVSGDGKVLLGRGNGAFDPGTPFGGGDYGVTLLKDLDGDGHLDVVNGQQQGVSIRLGNGDGTFGPATSIVFQGLNEGAYAVTVADLDGDGILDIAATWHHYNPGTYNVYVVMGAGCT